MIQSKGVWFHTLWKKRKSKNRKMSKVLLTDGHARPNGGVPPHAAALLAVRALGRGTGAVLGPRKAPLPTACYWPTFVFWRTWSRDQSKLSRATFPLLIISVHRNLKTGAPLSVCRCLPGNLLFNEPLWSNLGSEPFSTQFNLTKHYFQLATCNQAPRRLPVRVYLCGDTAQGPKTHRTSQAKLTKALERRRVVGKRAEMGMGNIVRSVRITLYVI